MPNRRRGDVALDLGGRRYALCLTLGALAELEDAFGVADLSALGERFASGRLSSRDLVAVLAIAMRGGGAALTDEDVASLPLASGGVEAIAGAIGDLLVATFGSPTENPPPPQAP